MGIFDSLSDAVVKKISGRDTVHVTPEELAQIVYEEFIGGADEASLQELEKAIKGKFFFDVEVTSGDGNFQFRVGALQIQGCLFLGIRRLAWVLDEPLQRYYQVDDRKYKNFKRCVRSMIEEERSKKIVSSHDNDILVPVEIEGITSQQEQGGNQFNPISEEQIIGKNKEYYLSQFEKIRVGERTKFNWAAFFFGLYHAAYRGVWRKWLSFMKVPLIACIIGTVALGIAFCSGGLGSILGALALTQIPSLLSFIFAIRYGKRFNRMYMYHVEDQIRQGELTGSVSWKRVLIVVVITTAVTVAAGMGTYIAISSASDDVSMSDTTRDEWVQNVKNGTNASYPGVTYGEAFKEFFSSPTWSYFEGSRVGLDGQEEYVSVVQFTGGCTYNGEEVTATIHFEINQEEETFRAEYLSFDGVAQERKTLSELIYSAFEGTQTATEPESQITEKMDPKESSTDEDISQKTENTSDYDVPADYVGIWGEAQSDSLYPFAMTIENPNGKYCDISICLWMGNAGGWQLEATGTYDSASNQIVYTDCQEYEIYYDEGVGDLVTELSSSGGSGSVYFQDGYLFWQSDETGDVVPFVQD